MNEQVFKVLNQVSRTAAAAGLKGSIDDDETTFQMGFSLPEGRSQVVYTRIAGDVGAGKTVVSIFSPCLRVRKGLFSSFSKERALDLLRRNEDMLFARFGIWERGEESMVVASVDHLLDTLDPDELRTSAWYVAIAADGYEKEHGRDSY